MKQPDETRVTLRRATHDVNDELDKLADSLEFVDDDAQRAVRRARVALFEAWTMLCKPPEEL
jgi:hypothetical protein